MSSHRPVLMFGVFESDGPRPPGANAGVPCQDPGTPRAIVAIAFTMAVLIAACLSAVGVHTTWL
jgi:hypothetical protein